MNNESITRKRTSKGHCTLAAEGKPQTLQDGLRGHHTPAQSRQGGLDHVQFMLFQAVQFGSVVQSLSRVPLFAIPWTAARQASLSITNSRSLLKLMSIESAMPSNHLILCRPLLLLPSILPNIRVFSNELVLRIRWLKYGVSASASVLPRNTLFQAEDLYNI